MASKSLHDQERLLSHSTSTAEGLYEDQPHSQERPWQRNFPWILNISLVLTTIILALQLSKGDRYQHTGDVNGIAPRFAQRIVTFQPEHRAAAGVGHPNQDEATNAFWKTFAPDNFGIVNLPDYMRERYPQLAPPTVQTSPDGRESVNLVDTSMAHQLHCLHRIMEAYNDLAANKTGGQMSHMRRHEGEHSPPTMRKPHHDHSWHLGHCFDYIRQGIMCCGDTALEGAATTFPHGIAGSDGWNAKHVCKDYGQVKDWIISMGP